MDKTIFRKADSKDADQLYEFMSNEKFTETSGLNLDSLKDVIKLTLAQKNLGFFVVAEDRDSNFKGVIMISKEYFRLRDQVYFWIQFCEATDDDTFKALLKHLNQMVSLLNYLKHR